MDFAGQSPIKSASNSGESGILPPMDDQKEPKNEETIVSTPPPSNMSYPYKYSPDFMIELRLTGTTSMSKIYEALDNKIKWSKSHSQDKVAPLEDFFNIKYVADEAKQFLKQNKTSTSVTEANYDFENESLLIEANHLASQMADGSIFEQVPDSNILDDTQEPENLNVSIDELVVVSMVDKSPSPTDQSEPKIAAPKSIYQREVLTNLSDILRDNPNNEFLSSLKEILMSSTSTNNMDSGNFSSDQSRENLTKSTNKSSDFKTMHTRPKSANARRGPMKATVSLDKMVKASKRNGLKPPKPPRSTTPIQDLDLKPVAQSTPDSALKDNQPKSKFVTSSPLNNRAVPVNSRLKTKLHNTSLDFKKKTSFVKRPSFEDLKISTRKPVGSSIKKPSIEDLRVSNRKTVAFGVKRPSIEDLRTSRKPVVRQYSADGTSGVLRRPSLEDLKTNGRKPLGRQSSADGTSGVLKRPSLEDLKMPSRKPIAKRYSTDGVLRRKPSLEDLRMESKKPIGKRFSTDGAAGLSTSLRENTVKSAVPNKRRSLPRFGGKENANFM